MEDEERQRLAATFDRAADLYQKARPEYPPELYDRLVEVTELEPPAELLEIGCATGKATLPLARRGFRITCLEPGRSLAAVARRLLAPFDADVIETRLEDWDGPAGHFRLVYAATVWHWVDPSIRYQKAANLLAPGGLLAFWEAGHVIPVRRRPVLHSAPRGIRRDRRGAAVRFRAFRGPQELPDQRAEIEASGLFDVVDVRQYDWEVVYDADSYIDLLNTFSGHIAMQEWQRDRLYGEIRARLAQRPDGRLHRHWGGVLHIARRRDG